MVLSTVETQCFLFCFLFHFFGRKGLVSFFGLREFVSCFFFARQQRRVCVFLVSNGFCSTTTVVRFLVKSFCFFVTKAVSCNSNLINSVLFCFFKRRWCLVTIISSTASCFFFQTFVLSPAFLPAKLYFPPCVYQFFAHRCFQKHALQVRRTPAKRTKLSNA